MTTAQQFVPVLLVDDDPGDVLITREAFEQHRIRNPLHVVTDGAEALRFLRREEEHTEAPRPGLILLDLNLPKVNGSEVLATVKTDAALRSIPVIVLTTSSADEDVRRSYDLHANAYITKPADFTRFVDVIQQIEDFFVTVVKLPVEL